MGEREDLARDIWKAGTADPDSLAEYLIREGWGKRRAAFTAGITSALDAVNSVEFQRPIVRPMTRGMLQ